ncbi:zinc finger-containing ubiquitin peptidase 1-like isoform X2 [Episyrphus balteatus]|uniref:zinc finger-containing ubiquitin peptidase 1-like isoform X2 n=1 Tax=Episyrphus balteatus TaxID=286459 RepID=UPI002486CA28|nr:zinc finger-containing ubiquitin peptidase 1-like isoform X2 [Episyrphus balteatus]
MSDSNEDLDFVSAHSCEICGTSGLSDERIREHTRTCHVEGNSQCPFCGLTGVRPPELLLHVNKAHLDYLTPEEEYSSPADGDIDSCMESTNNDEAQKVELSPLKIVENANRPFDHFNLNGESHNQRENFEFNVASCSKSILNENRANGSTSNSSQIKNGKLGHKNMTLNGFDMENMESGAAFGLQLKSFCSEIKGSISQCPLCPFTSDNTNILEIHINRSHFDPLSPSVNDSSFASINSNNAITGLRCPICNDIFETAALELHVNIEHRDILSPEKANSSDIASGEIVNICPVCNKELDTMKSKEMEMHIETHFPRSPQTKTESALDMVEKKIREQKEFDMLRAQYGMDDQGNFREQSAEAMQRAVYAGEMSVADYYERQVGLRTAESHGIDDGTSCTKSVASRVLALSSSSPGVIKSLLCSAVDHYASSYGDKGWGCGYRNLQMLLSSLLQNTSYNEVLYSAWGKRNPSRTAIPSISRLQKMVEAAWAQGFDVQGSEQLGCKLYNTRKWIGATEIVTVLSWLRINCQLIDFHRPTSPDGRHPELFNWVLEYFEQRRVHTPPLYLQHQGHSRTIVGIEQRSTGLTLLVLDPSHGPRQVAVLGSSQDSLRLIRRGPFAMRAPQYQVVAVRGLIKTEEQYQASKVLRSHRIPPDC